MSGDGGNSGWKSAFWVEMQFRVPNNGQKRQKRLAAGAPPQTPCSKTIIESHSRLLMLIRKLSLWLKTHIRDDILMEPCEIRSCHTSIGGNVEILTGWKFDGVGG